MKRKTSRMMQGGRRYIPVVGYPKSNREGDGWMGVSAFFRTSFLFFLRLTAGYFMACRRERNGLISLCFLFFSSPFLSLHRLLASCLLLLWWCLTPCLCVVVSSFAVVILSRSLLLWCCLARCRCDIVLLLVVVMLCYSLSLWCCLAPCCCGVDSANQP